MPTIDTLEALLKHELKDLYSAETQIIKSLPELIDAATNADLKMALTEHLSVTKKQKERLNTIQKFLGEKKIAPKSKGFFANLFQSSEGEEHCKAMEGLVKEGNSLLKEDMQPEVLDAAIIAAAQKIEHYEISSYGTAKAFAMQLQLPKVAMLLEETLKEEYAADDSLTKIALSKVNLQAETESSAKKAVKPKTVQASGKATPKKSSPKKVKAAPVKKAKSASSQKAKTAKAKSKR